MPFLTDGTMKFLFLPLLSIYNYLPIILNQWNQFAIYSLQLPVCEEDYFLQFLNNHLNKNQLYLRPILTGGKHFVVFVHLIFYSKNHRCTFFKAKILCLIFA